MTLKAARSIFVQTFKETIRSKWLIMFAAVFFLLAFNLPLAALMALNFLPVNYSSQFMSTIITVSFPLIPLLSLPLGSTSIVEERESGLLQYILSAPVSRNQFLVARLAGLFVATTAIIVIGFGIASFVAFRLSFGIFTMAFVVFASCVLNSAMLGLALFISVVSRRKATALGAGIFIWFIFSVISDSSLLAPIFSMAGRVDVVLPFILLNPVESARLLVLSRSVHSFVDLGAAGMAVNYTFGDSAGMVLLITMMLWIAITLAAAFIVFFRQDVR
jgi:Cu-processing system permease protein